MVTDNFIFQEEGIREYAVACKKIAEYLKENIPSSIICPLRGSYPPTRIISKIAGYDGEIHLVPTSECLLKKKEIIYSALEKIVKESSSKKKNILTIDTAISGTSTRKYVRLLKAYLPEISNKKIEYTLLKIWQRPEEVEKHKRINLSKAELKKNNKSTGITINNGVYFVSDLLCEDIPELLGINYVYNMGKDKKSEYIEKVESKNNIIIQNGNKEKLFFLTGDKTTADLFIDIIIEEIKKLEFYQNNKNLPIHQYARLSSH